MAAIDAGGLDEAEGAEAPKRTSRAPILAGLALMLLLGGGGFYAAYSGLVKLPFGAADGRSAPAHGSDSGAMPAFVPLGELVIPLGEKAKAKFLVIEAEIEARPEDAASFEALRPRILDAFNTFLRALDESDIETPSANLRLRAQLLRRLRVVTAPAEPRDLLITRFVLK